MLFALLLAASWPIDTKAVEFVKDFALTGDEYLGFPIDACLSPDGKLFVIDSSQSNIFAWNSDGSFDKTFAQPGNGPGELQNPFSITVDKDRVFVWEDRRVISIFDHQGVFIKSFHSNTARPRSFNPVGRDLVLLGYRSKSNDKMFMHFDLWNLSGEQAKTIFKEENRAFLVTGEGDNNAYVKSYLPEVEVTTGPNGNIYYGFSQNNTIYEMDQTGKILGEQRFELPATLPSERDKDIFNSMSFPMPGGGRKSLKDMPNIRVSFAEPKANYTHFTMSQDKIAFILTPLGSTDGVSNGYSRATFFICDMKSGKVLERGSYDLPEDSAVFYQNTKAIACILTEDGEYQVREMKIKGM